MTKVNLLVAPCSHKAAKFAVLNWHYSQAMPAGKLVKIGAWEDGAFIGVVIYSRGANNNIGKPYGLKQTEVCELVRVAFTTHQSPISKIVSIAQKILSKTSPNLRLIVSYADPEQRHTGIIYQAMNWIYVGKTKAQREVMYKGEIMHKRTANSLFGTITGLDKSPPLWKHKYIYPLDKEMRQKIEKLSQPYPK